MGQSVNPSLIPDTLYNYFMDQQKNPKPELKDVMKYEWMRLASFANFPLDSPVHTTRLAEAGFYYQGQEDEVTCFSCGVKHKGWAQGDVPVYIHREIYPQCPFLSGRETANIGIKQSPLEFVTNKKESIHLSESTENQTANASSNKETKEVNKAYTTTERRNNSAQTNGACGGPLDIEQSNKPESTRNGYLPRLVNTPVQNGQLRTPVQNGQLHTPVQNSHLHTPEQNDQLYTPVQNGQLRQPEPNKNVNTPVIQHSESRNPNTNNSFNFSFIPTNTANNGRSESNTQPVNVPQPTRQAEQEVARFVLEPLGISFERPVYPQYAITAIRLSSFKKWPKNVHQRPEELTKAGLFHEGVHDRVRCFFCGGGLFNWDPEDDPWIEHARWYPRCVYLRQTKGDEFVYKVQDEVQKGNENLSNLKDTNNLNKPSSHETAAAEVASSGSDNLLSHPAALSVLEMGVNPDLVKSALHDMLTTNDKNHLTAENLLVKVWEIEDNTSAGTTQGQHGEPLVNGNTQQSASDETSGNNFDSTVTTSHKSEHTPGIREADEAERIAIMEENRHLRELQLCKICLDEDVAIVFLPCGHMASCASCAPALRKCPICRTFIKGTVKAIIS